MSEARVTTGVLRAVVVATIAATLAACGPSAPSATPPPTAAPSAAVSPLPAGTYTSKQFKPAVTYTVPVGWDNPDDAPAYFHLRPGGSDVLGIYLFRDAVAMSQDASCPDTPVAGVGSTAKDLVTWMAGLPGLTASDPTPTTVGGLSGYQLDLGIRDGWKASCSFANGTPTVPLLLGTAAGFHWIVAGTERLRLYVLDIAAGGTVVVDVDAFDGSQIDALLNAATPIVTSLKFAKS